MGGARPPPLITFTITSKVALYAPAEWVDTLTLFHLQENMYSVYTSTTETIIFEESQAFLAVGIFGS